MKEAYTLKEIEEKLEHEKYLRKENQELYEELQVLRKCSKGTNNLANEYKKRIDKALEYIKDNAVYSDGHCKCNFSSMALDNLLDILQGSDSNEFIKNDD